MGWHDTVTMADPFTGRPVGIDEGMVPVIGALWARGIETRGCCQGTPGAAMAYVNFAEPRGYEWDPEAEDDDAGQERQAAAWYASRPDGARQVHNLLIAAGQAHYIPRWEWVFGDTPGPESGSAVVLPPCDVAVLASVLDGAEG